MSGSQKRRLSVAELLARNGTIGSPPMGGRRRRKRRNSDGVSVAELTGEIPIIRTGEIPVVSDSGDESDEFDEEGYEQEGHEQEGYEEEGDEETHEESEAEYVETEESDAGYREITGEVYEDTAGETAEVVYKDVSEQSTDYVAEGVTEEVAEVAEVSEVAEVAEVVEVAEVAAPPLANNPLPHRGGGPELAHDPRPLRRSSHAEQMAYDPVDEAVNIEDLIDEHGEDVEQLRSYLRASQDTLFSGGTVADDLARRGFVADADEDIEYEGLDETVRTGQAATVSASPRRVGNTVWNGLLAVLQSLLAVVVGAGLFIGFDQLWRWNNLVALILSVLVVLTLAALVRVVRKTEDIVSTLTAVAVGLLVTLGPLALQST